MARVVVFNLFIHSMHTWARVFEPRARRCRINYIRYNECLCYDSLIRKDCFTTNYFKGCLDALLITKEDEIQRVMNDISIIHQVPI